MKKIATFIKKNKFILCVCIIVIIGIIGLQIVMKKRNKELFSNKIYIKNADKKVNSILQKTKNTSKSNLIKLTHEWCANMRQSETKSISTACLPLYDEDGKNKKYFPISVCCSSCYCEILKLKNNGGIFNYKYDSENKMYYLIRDKKVVQVIEESDSENKCIELVNSKKKNKENPYFPLLSMKVIKEKICKS